MNVHPLFSKSPTPRPEASRPEPSRYDRPNVDRTRGISTRSERVARTDRSTDTDEPRAADEGEGQVKRKPTRAEFSQMLAILAGAGSNVRSELLKQVPEGNSSLIDKLLSGATPENEALPDSNGVLASLPSSTSESELLTSALQSSRLTTDAMRYGLLKDAQSSASDLALLNSLANGQQLPHTNDPSQNGELRGLSRALQSVGDHGHAREVLSRIASRRSTPVDQLKALGQNGEADVRVALDALLAQAGTPQGLEIAGAVDNAAVAAAATALAAANAASAADVTTPVRTTDALAPELRRKLERVMERMKGEYGHDVTVVETARSQERQDHLFEQGRTRPGNVVTWTRDSAHTRGEAVDVIIDGTYNNADGFARLQRIAKEEGLRTLGVRDPGHLELAGSGSLNSGADSASMKAAQATPLIANPAGASGVARVAGSAHVAGVARVAEPGAVRGSDRAMSNVAYTATSSPATGPASANGQGNAFGRGERDDQGRPMNDGRKLGQSHRDSARDTQLPASGSMLGAPTMQTLSNTENPTAVNTPAAGVSSADRVANLQDMRDSTPAGAVSRLTLNVDAPDGGQDRITVDLRGASVGTQISTDASNAERLRMRTAELQDALGRHGLESDSVHISGTTRTESTDAARIVAGDRDGIRLNAAQQNAAGDGTNNQGQRERAANAREWDKPESSRQSRDEQKESARQGAGQRGQRGTSNGSAS